MEFRRINALPPYVFGIMDALKIEARRAGVDVVDLGFGNPDVPSPDVAVDKLVEAVRNPRNHRYSASRGIPKLRMAVADLYQRKFGVELDPDTQVCSTIGAKEGFSHLMWVLLGPGDAALVPSPSYPIHIWGPILAGAEVRHVRLGPEQDFFENLLEAWEDSWPRPRVIVLSFPHNPTTACVDLDFMQRMVDFAREHEVLLVHDFAYADLGFDGYDPPSILQVPGATDVAVELYTMTKSFSMAGWRVGFLLGNAEVVAALAKLKSYLDYGTFQPIQIAATVTMNESPDYPKEANEIYRGRRNALIDGLSRVGWEIERPQGTMFVWAPIPEPYEELGSLEFAKLLVRDAKVAVSPGVGFGPGRRGLRAVRAGRERAPHQPGRPRHQARPHQARLTPAPPPKAATCFRCETSRYLSALGLGVGIGPGAAAVDGACATRRGVARRGGAAAGTNAASSRQAAAASAGDAHTPSAIPASDAAPSTVVSGLAGRRTVTPSTSAWNWQSTSIALGAAVDAQLGDGDAGGVAIASTTSAVCHAIASPPRADEVRAWSCRGSDRTPRRARTGRTTATRAR